MEHVHGVDIYDIYNVTYSPWWLQTWFAVVCGVTIIALLFLGVFFWYRFKKQTTLSYSQKILKELDALTVMLNTPENAHDFYCTITDLLKMYLSHRFNLHLYGLTDEELLYTIKHHAEIPHFVTHAVTDILQGIEVIKFGQGITVAEVMHKALEQMRKIVIGTQYLSHL